MLPRPRSWLTLAFTVWAAAAAQAHAEVDRVRISSGEVIGTTHDDVISFKGIPYAAPPIADLRWRAPREPTAWKQPLNAVDYGPSCPQSLPVERVPVGSVAERTSEDCLTLNIWTPTVRSQPLPVMVWIHGGGNHVGTGSERFFDGTAFARDGIVLVTLNYRLGRLGFLAHPALTKEAGRSPVANYGILDQMAALRWVQENIAAFGGNPHNVTVFGESAGAEDILVLMTVPSAAGLFNKAIAESAGGWSTLPSLADAERSGAEFMSTLKLNGASATVTDMRALPVEALVNAPSSEDFGPTVDGRLLPDAPVAAFARGTAVAIPMIIGTNGNEGSLLADDVEPGFALGNKLSGTDLSHLKKLYGTEAADEHQFARALFRDGFFVVPTRWAAAHASGPVFVYRFDYVMSLLRRWRDSATHGSEIPFVFEAGPMQRLSTADKATGATMHSCWVSFATQGTPSCEDAPAWPSYHESRKLLMQFGERIEVKSANPERAVLDFLQSRLLPQPDIHPRLPARVPGGQYP